MRICPLKLRDRPVQPDGLAFVSPLPVVRQQRRRGRRKPNKESERDQSSVSHKAPPVRVFGILGQRLYADSDLVKVTPDPVYPSRIHRQRGSLGEPARSFVVAVCSLKAPRYL